MFFLPTGAVGDGEHTVLVTLNADDHTIWAADGEPIMATATGMGDDHSHEDDHSHDDGDTADDGSADDAPTSPADVEFEFEPDEVHLHGYDLDTEVHPDQPGVLEFVADQTGRFELEIHEAGLVLLQLLVE